MTLRQKINGAIIITFILIAMVFTLIFIPFQNHRLTKAIDNVEFLLVTLVERDTEQLANEIFDNRLKAIRLRIKEMRRVKGILGITVFDSRGQQLVSDGTEQSRNGLAPGEGIIELGRDALVFSKQIRFLGEVLGFIQIDYALKHVQNEQKTFFLIFGGLLVTVLSVMLIVLNWILSRAILAPITYLDNAARYIVQGHLEKEITMSRRDELGNLAQSFEKMRKSIMEKIADLERTTSIIESTSDMVAIASPDKKIIYMNKAGKQMLEWKDDSPMGKKWGPDFFPPWALNMIQGIGFSTACERGTWEGETALIGPGGRKIPVSQVLISHMDSKGRLEYVSAIIRDISQSKNAEKELRYLRNYLANIIDSMPSLLVGVNGGGRVTLWNRATQRETGLTADQARGMDLGKALPMLADDMAMVDRAIQERSIQYRSKTVRQPQGRIRHGEVTVYPLEAGEIKGAVIRIDDVTKKVQFEEMIIQNEKMLSIGGLAAGMAHEINNPLAGVIQNANVLANRLTKDSLLPANIKAADEAGISMDALHQFMAARNIPRLITAITESGIRIAAIVENMLSFARKSDAAFLKHDPVDLMDTVLKLAATDFNLKKHFDFKSIRIQKQYQERLPRVSCERGKIQQVLLNLLSNGAHAMAENKGAENDPPPEFIIRLSVETDTLMLRMEIEDNGPGIDENTCKRIFEPFFTTKPVGIGTGLGLSVSYFIVTKHHGGTMDVISTPDRGSNFIVRLPLERTNEKGTPDDLPG